VGRILFAMFLLTPLIEIAGFVIVGRAIGLWPTLAGVVISAVLGALILRWQGVSLINEIRSSVGQRQVPARSIADAMMVAIAGVLLMLPGYFSDVIGLLLLLPPVRAGIYAFLKSRVEVVSTTTTHNYEFTQRRVDDGTIDLDDNEYRQR
jgi:UPF0716 protein FxsA